MRHIDELNRSLLYFDSIENHGRGAIGVPASLAVPVESIEITVQRIGKCDGAANVRASNQQVIASFRWQGLLNIVAL